MKTGIEMGLLTHLPDILQTVLFQGPFDPARQFDNIVHPNFTALIHTIPQGRQLRQRVCQLLDPLGDRRFYTALGLLSGLLLLVFALLAKTLEFFLFRFQFQSGLRQLFFASAWI